MGKDGRGGFLEHHAVTAQSRHGVGVTRGTVGKGVVVAQTAVLLVFAPVEDVGGGESVYVAGCLVMQQQVKGHQVGALSHEITFVAVSEQVAGKAHMFEVLRVSGSEVMLACQLYRGSVGVGEIRERGFQIVEFQVFLRFEIKRIWQRDQRESDFAVVSENHVFMGLAYDAEGLVQVLCVVEGIVVGGVEDGGVDGFVLQREEEGAGQGGFRNGHVGGRDGHRRVNLRRLCRFVILRIG